MSERPMRIIVEGVDRASDEFKAIEAAARRMGATVESSSRQASDGFKGVGDSAKKFSDNLTEVGVAAGAVVGAMALLGANARDQEREVDALTRAYGDSADEILSFTEAIQDSTNFSNDAARQAALTASTLTRAYGLSADQAQQLVAVSADLAQVYGIDLADATSRLAGAVRGEGEAAEALGLNLSDTAVAAAAAAAGFDTYATTATEAEKASFRFNLVLEQTAEFQGAAAEASTGAAAAGAAFRDFLDDTGEAAGRALGPVGDFLSVAGDIGLALPVIGGALGKAAEGFTKLAASQRVAAVTSRALSLAMAAGPLGLVTAAAGAVVVLGELTNWFGLAGDEAGDASVNVDTLTDAIYGMAQAGTDVQILTALREIDDQWLAVVATLDESAAAYQRVADAEAALTAATQPGASGADAAAAQNELAAATAALNEELATLDPETINAVSEALADLSNRADDALVDEAALFTDLNERLRQLQSKEISPEQFLFFLNDMIAHFNEWYVILPKVEGATDEVTRAIGALTTEVGELTGGMTDFGAVAEDVVLVLGDATTGADELGGAADNAGEAIGGLDTSLASALGPLGQFVAMLDEHAAQLALVEAGIADAADRQADYNAQVEAGARTQAEYNAATQAGIEADREAAAARRERNDAQREGALLEQMATTRDSVVAARELEQSIYDQSAALGGQIVSLDDAAAAMDSYTYASFAAVDGAVSLAEQGRLLNIQYTEAGVAIAQQTSDLNDMEAAYELLQARQAEGQALTQSDIDYMREYESELAGNQRAIDDQIIAQGKLVQAQQDNTAAQETMTGQLDDVADAVVALVDALKELFGLDGDDFPLPPERTAIAWTEAAQAVAFARDVLAGAGVSAGGGVPQAGDASGGPAPGAGPAGRQGRAGSGTGRLPVAPANIAPPPIPITADNSQAIQVIEDTDSALVTLVTDDHTVILDGDAGPAVEAVAFAARTLAEFDGTTASAYILANAEAFYRVINAIDGATVGTAYIQVLATGGGFQDLTRASGGVVGARDGRVVEMGEIGPEWVYPPGGRPFLAAQHGLYVVPGGTYVSNAAATAGSTTNNSPVFNLHFHGMSARDGGVIRREVQAAVTRSFAAFGR